MNAHVSNIARTCYIELRRLASIRRFLTSTATAKLVSDTPVSHRTHCIGHIVSDTPVPFLIGVLAVRTKHLHNLPT